MVSHIAKVISYYPHHVRNMHIRSLISNEHVAWGSLALV